MLIFQKKFKITFLIMLIFGLMFFADFRQAESTEGWECQELPLGQISERLLEMRIEMLKESFLIKKEYERMFSPSREITDLAYNCWKDCENHCSCSCGGGNPCYNLAEIDQQLVIAESFNQTIQESRGRIENIVSEMEEFKTKIRKATTTLAQWNPEEKILVDCVTAKAFGYINIENCSAANNYYICQWSK